MTSKYQRNDIKTETTIWSQGGQSIMSKIMHDLNYVHNYYMDGADNIKLKPAYDSLMDKLPYENREFLLNLMKFLMYSKMIHH